MACEYTFKGKVLSEAEFKQMLLDDAELLAKAKEETGEKKVSGIAHRVLQKMGIDTEPAEGWTPEEAHKVGKDLLSGLRKEGVDPNSILFNKDDKSLSLGEKVALRKAVADELAVIKNKAGDTKGIDSKEYQDAKKAESDFLENTKYLGGEAQKGIVAFQGETDIDTGSFTSLVSAWEKETGKTPDKATQKELQQLANDNKSLEDKNKELQQKLYDALNKLSEQPKGEKYATKAKEIADKFRQLKSKPITFKDANGNEIKITKLSVVDWDGLVELGAKAIEKTGEIADGVKAIIDELTSHDWYKNLNDADKGAVNKQIEGLFDVQEKKGKSKESLLERFAGKTDSNFSVNDVKDIWGYAKENYVDKGFDNWDDMTKSVADDLGLSQKQVIDAFSKPKSAREITNAIYRVQSRRRDAINNAKVFIKSANEPTVSKILKMLPSFWFQKAVFGHGTVGMITHAGSNIFRPSGWGTYFKNFARQFQFLSRTQHEKFMQQMENSDDFAFWKRNGLAIDPHKIYSEYEKGAEGKGNIITRGLKEWSKAGNRGFDALKAYRLDQAKTIWDGIDTKGMTKEQQTETAKAISRMVNGATGHSETGIDPSTTVGKIVNTAFFAPKLEASRWKRLVADPINILAVKTPQLLIDKLSGTEKLTPADKVIMKQWARRTGEGLATFAAMLAANQGLLSATGSNQKINYTDPTQPDFLRFKGFGQKGDISGGMLSTSSFISSILEEMYRAHDTEAKQQRSKPMEKVNENFAKQVRYKLSPFVSTVVDFAWGETAMGEVTPMSAVKPHKGQQPLTWGEYIERTQTPIPVATAFREVAQTMKEKGMDKSDVKTILGGILEGLIVGGTGAHVLPDIEKKQKHKATPHRLTP